MKLKFLHTNDFHGKLDESILLKLKQLRKGCDYYFDSGDAIKAGNLAIPMAKDSVWNALRQLDCTASVLGNRETHPLRSAFEKKIEGHSHPVLAGNMTAKDGSDCLPKTLVLEKNGFKLGVVSTMVAMATPAMKASGAWSCLWSNPIETAAELAGELRPQVDLLVALTHIGFVQDQALAQRCPDIDIIFGGHSHTVLPNPLRENKTWIVQGGSHGRYAGVYEWENGVLTGELVPLSRSDSQS
jgi:5'-nucleotidase